MGAYFSMCSLIYILIVIFFFFSKRKVDNIETRVYKYFLDCILNNQDIVLKSTGSTIINFSYTIDTVLGILYILLSMGFREFYL